jgi:hypothetical protein
MALIQAQQWLKEKVGSAKKTADTDYEELFHKQDNIRETTQKLNKHLQQLVDNFHAFSATLQFIAEDFSNTYDGSDALKATSDELLQMCKQLETNAVIPFQKNVSGLACAKLSDYLVAFEDIKAIHKTRTTAQREYDYRRDEVEKLTEKPSKDPMKLPKAKEKFAEAKENYDLVNEEGKRKINELLQSKSVPFDYAMETFLRSLASYQKTVMESVEKLLEMEKKFPPVQQQNLDDFLDDRSKNTNKGVSKSNLKQMPPSLPSKVSSSSSSGLSSASLKKVPPKYADCEWFYLDGKLQQKGPLTFSQLKDMFKRNELTGESYVFGPEDMSDWKEINSLTELLSYLKI